MKFGLEILWLAFFTTWLQVSLLLNQLVCSLGCWVGRTEIYNGQLGRAKQGMWPCPGEGIVWLQLTRRRLTVKSKRPPLCEHGALFWGTWLGSNWSRAWFSAFTHHQKQVPLCWEHPTQPCKTAQVKGTCQGQPTSRSGDGNQEALQGSKGTRSRNAYSKETA